MKSRGFALPAVIILSTAMLILLYAVIQNLGSIREYAVSAYHVKLAEEAAEAGTAYADACLQKYGHIQTWNNTDKKLTEKTNCYGILTYTSNDMILPSATLQISFEVGDLDVASDGSVQISSKGTVNVRQYQNGPILKTHTSYLKKIIVWNADLNGEKSIAGTNRTCGILSGKVWCWGRNDYGQLGNAKSYGTTTKETRPLQVERVLGALGNTYAVEVFAAQYHTCTLITSGKVFCWGRNNYGQLGNGNTVNSYTPVEVTGNLSGKIVTKIGGSGDTSCAITTEQKIYCWGRNDYGQAGINSASITQVTNPTQVASGLTNGLPANYAATSLSSAGTRSFNMCAVADGKAYCWGPNGNGQLGDNFTCGYSSYWGTYQGPCRRPVRVYDGGALSGKIITDITQDGFATENLDGGGGSPHVCVVTQDFQLYCWGYGSYGQIGYASYDTSDYYEPMRVNSGAISGKQIKQVSAGLNHTCALDVAGKAYCWGSNSSGQIGTNSASTSYYTTPQAVYPSSPYLNGKTVQNISAGANRGCAIVNGLTYCWGLNDNGQIGDGTVVNRYAPTESLFMRPKNNEYVY